MEDQIPFDLIAACDQAIEEWKQKARVVALIAEGVDVQGASMMSICLATSLFTKDDDE